MPAAPGGNNPNGLVGCSCDGLFASRDIAAYIAQECRARNIPWDNTKMQRLLFCVYGILLAWKNTRACDEFPRAWSYGPVFPKVFFLIRAYQEAGQDIADFSTVVRDSEHSALKTVVATVLQFFGPYSASALSAWTQRQGSPWWKVHQEGRAGWNSFIPDAFVRDYFLENVLTRQ